MGEVVVRSFYAKLDGFVVFSFFRIIKTTHVYIMFGDGSIVDAVSNSESRGE